LELIEGVIKIANVFLALVAGFIALSLFKISHERKKLRPWKMLIIALVLLSLQEILGALRAFRIFESPFLTHIVPTAILAFLLSALILQIEIVKKRK
jgi:ABC-type transport system involved in cytochrome c biogenesis permease subunit